MLLWWGVLIAISHGIKVKKYWRNNICWRDAYKCFCSPRCFLLVHWLNSWFLFVLFSSSSMLSKLLKVHSRVPDKWKKLSVECDPQICLLIHRYVLAFSWGRFKIVLESVKCDFEEISNKYLLFLQNVFKLTMWKMAIGTIRDSSKKLRNQ